MNCRETLQEAFLYLDGELLSEERRIEISHHLEECRPCLERYGLHQEVALVLARLRGCTRCPDDLRTRIYSMFDDSTGRSTTL